MLPESRPAEPIGPEGVVQGRALRQPGQEAGLRQAEIVRRLAEVDVGGRLHAEGLVPVEDLVQVHLQDLVLAVALLHLDGQQELAYLLSDGAMGLPVAGLEHVVLDHLLGDGAAALGGPAMDHVVHGGRHHPHRADRPMGVVVAVLDGDGGMAQVPADGAQGNHGAPFLVAFVEQGRAIAGVDAGGLRQGLRAEVAETGQFSRVRVQHAAPDQRADQEQHPGRQQEPAEQVARPARSGRVRNISPPSSAPAPAPVACLTHLDAPLTPRPASRLSIRVTWAAAERRATAGRPGQPPQRWRRPGPPGPASPEPVRAPRWARLPGPPAGRLG